MVRYDDQLESWKNEANIIYRGRGAKSEKLGNFEAKGERMFVVKRLWRLRVKK